MKYRRKTQTIDAIQWTGNNYAEMLAAFPESILPMVDDDTDKLVLKTPNGTMLALPGDYVFRGNDHVLGVCLPDYFLNNYEAIG